MLQSMGGTMNLIGWTEVCKMRSLVADAKCGHIVRQGGKVLVKSACRELRHLREPCFWDSHG